MSAQSGRFDRRIRPAVEKVRKESQDAKQRIEEGPSENEKSKLEQYENSFFERENLIKVLSDEENYEKLLSHFGNNLENFKSVLIEYDQLDAYDLIVDNFGKVYNAYMTHMSKFKSSSEKQPCKKQFNQKQPAQKQSGKKQPCKKQPAKINPEQIVSRHQRYRNNNDLKNKGCVRDKCKVFIPMTSEEYKSGIRKCEEIFGGDDIITKMLTNALANIK